MKSTAPTSTNCKALIPKSRKRIPRDLQQKWGNGVLSSHATQFSANIWESNQKLNKSVNTYEIQGEILDPFEREREREKRLRGIDSHGVILTHPAHGNDVARPVSKRIRRPLQQEEQQRDDCSDNPRHFRHENEVHRQLFLGQQRGTREGEPPRRHPSELERRPT